MGRNTPFFKDAHHKNATPLLAFKRVSRFFRPDKAALFDVSFDLMPGEFVYISGVSGAGKSTLMRLALAMEHPDTGAVFFAGHDIRALKRSAISVLRQSIGMIFQDYYLVPDFSAAANVALPLEVAGMSPSAIRARIAELFDIIGLKGREMEMAANLSGGEQQRVAIARALANRPELVLADEPTGSLDAYHADFILDILENTARTGTAVVLATHDRMLMAARPHRVITLDKGRVVGASQREPIHSQKVEDNTFKGVQEAV